MTSYQYHSRCWSEKEARVTELEAQVTELEAQVKEYERVIHELKQPSWIKCLIEPIAKGMKQKMPGLSYSILGPFGIGARTSIHFNRNDEFQKMITFEPGRLPQLCVVDHTVNTKQYRPGTIGAMNGFNYRTVPVPENATIQWFIDWMNRDTD